MLLPIYAYASSAFLPVEKAIDEILIQFEVLQRRRYSVRKDYETCVQDLRPGADVCWYKRQCRIEEMQTASLVVVLSEGWLFLAYASMISLQNPAGGEKGLCHCQCLHSGNVSIQAPTVLRFPRNTMPFAESGKTEQGE
jgi:hypothetical protein